MKRVFILVWEYDCSIVGVFTTRKMALEHLEKLGLKKIRGMPCFGKSREDLFEEKVYSLKKYEVLSRRMRYKK